MVARQVEDDGAPDRAEALLRDAARTLYRYFRPRTSSAEAMSDTLNELRAMLDHLAAQKGHVLDFTEHPRSATDVEYVSQAEFDRRAEVLWFSFARDMARDDLTPGEAKERLHTFRQSVRDEGNWLYHRGGVR